MTQYLLLAVGVMPILIPYLAYFIVCMGAVRPQRNPEPAK